MFNLVAKDIHLNQNADNKEEAIGHIASSLVKGDFVSDGYGKGMLEREQQSVTYLGCGIAIPHGTTATRDLVKKTGVQIFHFPAGVKWGDDGELAYIAIGIAASSDEHLSLLRQLTHVLSVEGIEEQLKNIQSAEDIIGILTDESVNNTEIIIDASLMSWDIPADDLSVLQMFNVSRLKKIAAVDSEFIANVIEKPPTYLGQGIWLTDSPKGNLKNAIAISKPQGDLQETGKPIKMLITLSSFGEALNTAADRLASLLFNKKAETLLTASQADLTGFFKSEKVRSHEITNDDGHADTAFRQNFVVLNSHGLHTRPGSNLVKLIKNFDCSVTVSNLNSTNNKTVNAASLMKLVSIGAKKGDCLCFTATGNDAEKVLVAIGEAMSAGLGEGIE